MIKRDRINEDQYSNGINMKINVLMVLHNLHNHIRICLIKKDRINEDQYLN